MYIQEYTDFEASPILVWFFFYLYVPIFLFWPCPIFWFGVSTTELSDVTSISVELSQESQGHKSIRTRPLTGKNHNKQKVHRLDQIQSERILFLEKNLYSLVIYTFYILKYYVSFN